MSLLFHDECQVRLEEFFRYFDLMNITSDPLFKLYRSFHYLVAPLCNFCYVGNKGAMTGYPQLDRLVEKYFLEISI